MMGVFGVFLSGFSITADGLWVDVKESYYCSGLVKARLMKEKEDKREEERKKGNAMVNGYENIKKN